MRDLTNETTNSANSENHTTTSILPVLAKVDPQLADDAKAQICAEKERLALVSRENGAKGGRPRIVRKELAKECYDNIFSQNGHGILYHYRGEWHLYVDGCYVRTPEEDIEKKVAGWLIRNEAPDVTKNIVKDVLVNLKSDEFCGLTSKHTMPCFISTGESANGFVSMKNGVINIDEIAAAQRNGLPPPPLLPHTQDLFTTFKLPYEYDPAATCPKFITYLEGVQPRAENREILQMLAGLLLTPDTSYNVGFFLYGPGGTGKSVFLSVLIGLVGEENTCCVPLGDFGSRFGTWPLTTHLLNAVGDMPAMPESGWSANVEGCYKDVTDGRLVKVERKNENVYMAKVTARNVFATNELPYFADRSGAIRDRLRIIPFNQRFRNTAKQNSHLTEELLEELPGIMNWAIKGLVKLHELTASSDVKTFPHCEEGRQAVDDYLGSCDHEQEFLLEATESVPDNVVGSLYLYGDYKDWATERGYRAVAIRKFLDAVKREYPNATFSRRNDEHKRKVTFIQGISLLPFS